MTDGSLRCEYYCHLNGDLDHYEHLIQPPTPPPSPIEAEECQDDTPEAPATGLQFLSGAFVANMFDYDSDKEDMEPESNPSLDQMHQIASGQFDMSSLRICTPEYWAQFRPNGKFKSCASQGHCKLSAEDLEANLTELNEDGYFVLPGFFGNQLQYQEFRQTILALQQHGWPPVFAFMFDELWELLSMLWDIMEKALGDNNCVLDPSVFLWSLASRSKPQDILACGEGDEQDKQIGNNFGLPHRDFSHRESFFEDGTSKILNCWIPLIDCSLDNGCLVVVPKEFDPVFDQPDAPTHMKSATPCYDQQNLTKLSFDLQGARPVPCPKGSVITWQGNLIHWGSRCSKKAQEQNRARMSFACTFRRAKSANDSHATETHLTQNRNSPQDITKATILKLSLPERLRYIASSLLLYEFWYPLAQHPMPSDFFDRK